MDNALCIQVGDIDEDLPDEEYSRAFNQRLVDGHSSRKKQFAKLLIEEQRNAVMRSPSLTPPI